MYLCGRFNEDEMNHIINENKKFSLFLFVIFLCIFVAQI